MAQSLSKLYVHLIFHVKDNTCLIKPEEESELYAYIGGIIKQSGSIPIIINGTEDHIHILCVMSKNIALSALLEDIKRNSSRWIKSKDPYYRNFAWQGGYAGFSVSQSKVDVVKEYIKSQKEHHKKSSFQEEYVRFLNEYGVEYNELYLWN